MAPRWPVQIYVYSRRALEATRPHEVPHVVVSITSHASDVARIAPNPMCREVLRLAFVDREAAADDVDEASLFSEAQAESIWRLVDAHEGAIERIVVHCDAGVSRSAAVGAALARTLNGDDAEFFAGRYTPNRRVYEMLLAMRGRSARP